jgi:hypothetical protein
MHLQALYACMPQVGHSWRQTSIIIVISSFLNSKLIIKVAACLHHFNYLCKLLWKIRMGTCGRRKRQF